MCGIAGVPPAENLSAGSAVRGGDTPGKEHEGHEGHLGHESRSFQAAQSAAKVTKVHCT
jgi:hypothetical protein